MLDSSKTMVTANTLDDWKRKATNVTDHKKLVEILDHFSDGTPDEVFLVQNEENPDNKGVMISLEYYAELLSYEEAIKEVFGYLVKEEVTAQKNK